MQVARPLPKPLELTVLEKSIKPPDWAFTYPSIWRWFVVPAWKVVDTVANGIYVGGFFLYSLGVLLFIVVAVAVAAGVGLVVLYFIVRFVRWAWMQP